MANIPTDPKLAKDLAEEHERDLLEQAQADRLAKDPDRVEDDYEPVTDDEDDIIPPRKENTHVKKD